MKPQISQIAQIQKKSDPNLRRLRLIILVLCCTVVASCHGRPRHLAPPTTQAVSLALENGLTAPVQNTDVLAIVVAPQGWKPEALKSSPQHKHQVWISPSGNTAYGVIYFQLPWPVGSDLALSGFLQQMKQSEGEAKLLSQADAKDFPGIRFIADGGQYQIRGNLIVNGFDGWVVYTGTLIAQPINYPELRVAVTAREQTRVAGQE